MTNNFIRGFLILVLITFSNIIYSQANLTIENKSKRTMTVKVMKGYGEGDLFKTITIEPFGEGVVYFDESGTYFTKTKAVLSGKDPIYRKGDAFQVTNDSRGYSILTLTFSITESSVPRATGGKQISKSEFDKN